MEISSYLIWNAFITLVLAPILYNIRQNSQENKRIDILLNKTREEIAKDYVTKDESDLHRILLCSGMKTTIPKVNSKIQKGEDFDNKRFFTTDSFYLKKPKTVPQAQKKLHQALY